MQTTSSLLAQSGGTASTTAATLQSAAFLGILNGDTEFSASNAGLFGRTDGDGDTVKTISFPTASLVDFDVEGVRAFKVGSAGVSSFFPQFTRVNDGQL